MGVFVGFLCIPLNAELNPICHLLALLGGATIVVISRLRVNYHTHTHIPIFKYRTLRKQGPFYINYLENTTLESLSPPPTIQARHDVMARYTLIKVKVKQSHYSP